MVKRMLLVFAVAGVLSLFTGFAVAADQERAQEKVQTQEQEQVYGSQLMTQQERAEYRGKMSAAQSAEEQEHIRKEHHEHMKERAKASGVTLPEEPGMGPCGGGRGR